MNVKFVEVIDRIESVRKNSGLNRTNFCGAFGMNPQNYHNVTGRRCSKPSVELLMGVSKSYDVSVDWLLLGDQGHSTPAPATTESLIRLISGEVASSPAVVEKRVLVTARLLLEERLEARRRSEDASQPAAD